MSKHTDEASRQTPKQSDAKKSKPSPDSLPKSGNKTDVELNEEELKRVTGGFGGGGGSGLKIKDSSSPGF